MPALIGFASPAEARLASEVARQVAAAAVKCCRPPRMALGPESARVAEERGAAMTLDTATEFLLLVTESHRHASQQQARHRSRVTSVLGT